MQHILFGALVIFAIVVPRVADAALLINEIAWMGTTVGANEEWIELHNDGEVSVTVDGWVLSDNVSLEISLVGTIGAGEFAVLERTDDDTVSGTAFLIYTGALSNDGRTLTLLRADASIEDQVAGGEAWADIGGDNTTKETAQRTLGGWVTATPTPGATNVSSATPDDDSTEETPATTTSSASDATQKGGGTSRSEKKTVTLKDENTVLELSLRAPSIAYVNQPVQFEVVPKGAGRTILNSLRYAWNFGDAYTATGKNPIHTFVYPGEYVVVVEAIFKKQKAYIRHEVTALPILLEVDRNERGDVLVHNNARYEVDISGYRLHGTRTFIFPKNTILKPQGTLTLAASRVGATNETEVLLYDNERNLMPERETADIAYTTPVEEPFIVGSVSAPHAPRSDTDSVESIPGPVRIGPQTAAVQDARPALDSMGKTGALIALLCAGILALYARRGAV